MTHLGTLSYLAAALAFAVLAVLLRVGWKGGRDGLRFILAACVSAFWATLLAASVAREQGLPVALVFTVEMLRDGAWLVALAGLAHGVLPRALAVGSQSLCFVLAGAVWIVPFLIPGWSPGAVAASLLIPAGIAVAVIVLLLLEQIYRNASSSGRYALKFVAIGLGGVYVYDLFLFSQAQLFQSVSEDFWNARGLVNAALVPLIALAARRNPQWSLDVFVSRQAVLFTTSVVAIGVYLLLMSLGGYYIQHFGGSWGVIANLLFVSGAMVVLAVIVMSGAVRRRLRVFVHKHFYRNKYDYRVEWLRFVATLSTAEGADMRRTSLQAIAQVFESDGALLYLRSESSSRYEPVAAWPGAPEAGLSLQGVEPDHEFIAALAGRKWVIDLREYREAPEFYQNLEVPAELAALSGYRIITPLLHSGALLGFVLLRDPPPPFALTYEDRDLMLTLGRHVAVILAQQEAEGRLADARQFEAYHRLTAFMMHDLKNMVAQLNLVVANAARHRQNPAFVDDAFATVANAASRMTQLISQLSRREGDADNRQRVDVGNVLDEVLQRCADREPRPLLLSSASPDEAAFVLADRARLSAVIEHVIRNAQDASPPTEPLEVSLQGAGRQLVIEVRDRGEGMTAEFVRTRLFRPFDSTKGSKGMGVGAYQVSEYVRSLGGDVEVRSSPGTGTAFSLRLPRHE